MPVIFSGTQLLTACSAEPTQTNLCIAQTIVNMYMQAKNFYQESMIDCMSEFVAHGNLDFKKYHIQF